MRCVLVVENHQLLGAGIEKLLRREADLLVLGLAPENEGALLLAISQSRPDVVVLDEATTDAIKLVALLEHHPNLRVVVVGADDEVVRTYESRQVAVTQTTELVSLIRG